MSRIILIGGPPRCGKTTLAKRVSHELGIPWISTDAFDDIVKEYVPAEERDKLFPKTVLRNIAIAFDKKTFIIFGATHPKYLHITENTIPIYDSQRHALCHHANRQEEIDCCEEFCMDRIFPTDVYQRIRSEL